MIILLQRQTAPQYTNNNNIPNRFCVRGQAFVSHKLQQMDQSNRKSTFGRTSETHSANTLSLFYISRLEAEERM